MFVFDGKSARCVFQQNLSLALWKQCKVQPNPPLSLCLGCECLRTTCSSYTLRLTYIAPSRSSDGILAATLTLRRVREGTAVIILPSSKRLPGTHYNHLSFQRNIQNPEEQCQCVRVCVYLNKALFVDEPLTHTLYCVFPEPQQVIDLLSCDQVLFDTAAITKKQTLVSNRRH